MKPCFDKRIMTFIAQSSPYTCALACLESFYCDQKVPIGQQSLLRDHPTRCFVGRKLGDQDVSGALTLSEFADLCSCLDLEPLIFRDFRREATVPLIRNIEANQAVIFFIAHLGGNGGPTHFVRFSHMIGPDAFEVMNPSGNPPFFTIAWQDFVSWDTSCVRITLPNPKA